MGQRCTIVWREPSGVDRYNNRLLEPDPLRQQSNVPCRFQPAIGARAGGFPFHETLAGQDVRVTDWRVDLPRTAQIDSLSAVINEETGDMFEVLGAPYPVQGPSGQSHWEVPLRLVAGG